MIFNLEEKDAIYKFGQNYLNYKKEVSVFNFSKDCLKKLFENIE